MSLSRNHSIGSLSSRFGVSSSLAASIGHHSPEGRVSPLVTETNSQWVSSEFLGGIRGFPRRFLNSMMSALSQTSCQHVLLNLQAMPEEECDEKIHLLAKSLSCLFGVSCGILRCSEHTQPQDFYHRSTHPSLSPTVSSNGYYNKHCTQTSALIFSPSSSRTGIRGIRPSAAFRSYAGNSANANGMGKSGSGGHHRRGSPEAPASGPRARGGAGVGKGDDLASATSSASGGAETDAYFDNENSNFEFKVNFTDDDTELSSASDATSASSLRPHAVRLGGPIFSRIFIVHNLDLVPAHTQSVLLQAMRLKKIFIDGAQHSLPANHVIICTHHTPPPAQPQLFFPRNLLDEFLVELIPNASFFQHVGKFAERVNAENIPIVTMEDAVHDLATVQVTSAVSQYMRDVIACIRQHCWVAIGPSPQAVVAFLQNAKMHALLSGVRFVRPVDIDAVVVDSLSHRIMLRQYPPEEAHLRMQSARALLHQLVTSVLIPPK